MLVGDATLHHVLGSYKGHLAGLRESGEYGTDYHLTDVSVGGKN